MKPLLTLLLSTITATSAPLTVTMTITYIGQGQVNITARTLQPVDGPVRLVLLAANDPGAHTWTPVVTNTYNGITITNRIQMGTTATFFKVRGLP